MSKPGTTLAERILNRLFKKREIVNCDRDVYLHRWYVFRSKPVSLFIHKFVRSDEDRALHCHPWDFLVIPIWRGYIEHNEIREAFNNNPKAWTKKIRRVRVLPIFGTRFRRAEYRHRVELLTGRWTPDDAEELPSWSLFFHFTKRRDWGFWLPGGFKQWAAFWQEKCE